MNEKKHAPVPITQRFFQIGTPAYPAYLSLGDVGMIIEGGTSASFPVMVKQIKAMGIPPERIEYIALTHTHPDHIGAVPHLKKLWPHLRVIASTVAAERLANEDNVKEFVRVDGVISEILIIKGELDEWPPEIEDPHICVDMVLSEGDTIDLGAGTTWTVAATPGHSPCHTSYFNESEGILIIGDATGLFDPEKDLFWPNYFDSLETYCQSIRKLATFNARIGALSHNGVVFDVRNHLKKALSATASYHREMLAKLAGGEDYKKVSLGTAKWVYTFTNMQPFEVIHGLSRLMLKRSQAATCDEDLFTLP